MVAAQRLWLANMGACLSLHVPRCLSQCFSWLRQLAERLSTEKPAAVHFQKLGLGGIKNGKSLGAIALMLGHVGRQVSVIKVDIEGFEWALCLGDHLSRKAANGQLLP